MTTTRPQTRVHGVQWFRSPPWRRLIRQGFGAACDGCGARLPVGVNGPTCTVCDIGNEPIGVWRQGPGGLPLLAAWRYGGPIASAIVAAKFHGGSIDPACWLGGLETGLAGRAEPGDVLVPIAPHIGRLRRRGHHVPDELARAIQDAWPNQQVPAIARATLWRVDDAAPRSAGRDAEPVFVAGGPCPAVWLIDDVVTTGRTLSAAREALARCQIDVRGALCLADAGSVNGGIVTDRMAH